MGPRREGLGRDRRVGASLKIDCHAHVVERRYVEELAADAGLKAEALPGGQTLLRKDGHTYAWYREAMFDLDGRLREMDAKGVDLRVLSLSTPNVYEWQGERQGAVARRMNDVTAAITRRHPERFAGLGSLPLGDIPASLSEIDRITGELGLQGVMIGSNVAGMPMNHPRMEPVWKRLNALKLPVFEHPMFPVDTAGMEEFELPLRVGFVYETTTAAARMIYAGIFERYPDFPYLLAHTGGALLTILERLDNGYRLFPDCRKYITRLPSEYAKRLYYDTCSFYGPTLMMAHGIVGPERLLWGSDDPYIGADTRHVDLLPIPQADKALILGGNAARLFKLKVAAFE